MNSWRPRLSPIPYSNKLFFPTVQLEPVSILNLTPINMAVSFLLKPKVTLRMGSHHHKKTHWPEAGGRLYYWSTCMGVVV